MLPLAEEARRVCELLGLRVLAVGQADLTLGINVRGSPESGDYNRIGRQYAGANLGGEITLRDRAGKLLVQEFSFTYEKPEMIVYQIRVGAIAATGPHPRPESAPFPRTLPGYQCALLELAARGWGEGMLERALKVTGGTLPAAAACVLGETGGNALRAAVPGLIGQLKAESAEARAAAAWALGQSGDPVVLAPLLAALDEPGRWPGERSVPDRPDDMADPITESAATFALHIAGEGREVFQHDFTRDQLANHYIYTALLALAERKAASDLPSRLMAALREGRTADQRAGAAILLGELRAVAARETLQAALRDQTHAVRGCAMMALAALDDPQAIGPLVDLLGRIERRPPFKESGQNPDEDEPDTGEDMAGSLENSLRDALHELTGEQFDRAADWQRWWKENRARLDSRN